METSNRSPRKALAILALAAYVVMVTCNALANILPLNGVNTGTLSDEIPNLFVPAGLTFAVWGLIYLLLAGLAVAILADAFGKSSGQAWTSTDGGLLIANYLANALWIFAWHWRLVPLSLVLMLVILGTLIALSERSYAARSARGVLSAASGGKRILRFFLATPAQVYLGWICVATIANVTALLVTAGWKGFGLDPAAWTVLAIVAGCAVALALVFRRAAVAAPLVVVWAYAGIIIKRLTTDPEATRPVWIAASAALALILLALALRAPRRRGTA